MTAQPSLRELLAAAYHESRSMRHRLSWLADRPFDPYCRDAATAILAALGPLPDASERLRPIVEDFADQLVAIIGSKWADRPTADAAVRLWRRDLTSALAAHVEPGPK